MLQARPRGSQGEWYRPDRDLLYVWHRFLEEALKCVPPGEPETLAARRLAELVAACKERKIGQNELISALDAIDESAMAGIGVALLKIQFRMYRKWASGE